MRIGTFKRCTMVVAALALLSAGYSFAQDLPKPELRYVGVTDLQENGRSFRLFEFEIVNRDEFSNDLFVPSPALPPCGKNANASRTWINIYNEKGSRIYGYCAINANGELSSIKFAIPSGGKDPKKVFVDFVDRFERKVVRSNTLNLER